MDWTIRLNRIALALALVCFAGLGAWWAIDRAHPAETPRWRAVEFAPLEPPARPAGPCWMVAVNPSCPHCRARLADLARRGSAAAAGAALGAILVDLPGRPDSLLVAGELPAGVWWDSANVWRERWRRRVYGETLEFDGAGRLERIVDPAGGVDAVR